MIALLIGLAVAGIVGVAVGAFIGSVSSSRGLAVVVALALTPTVAFVPVALSAIAGSEGTPPAAMVSHAQLEADRAMTQQMAVAVGPGMEAVMAMNGMLGRSSDPAYVAALEQHVQGFDRMTGRSTP